MLDAVRRDTKYSHKAIECIQKECKEYNHRDGDLLHLCCYKKNAKSINDREMKSLTTAPRTFYAQIEGASSWKDAPVDLELTLKVGAKVLICANDINGAYVNGSRGEVINMGVGS